MKKTMICFAVAVLAAGARAVPYSEGDRVVFYGDSVTHHGHYVTPIQTFARGHPRPQADSRYCSFRHERRLRARLSAGRE